MLITNRRNEAHMRYVCMHDFDFESVIAALNSIKYGMTYVKEQKGKRKICAAKLLVVIKYNTGKKKLGKISVFTDF